jgi:hypothetical protein
MPRCQGRRVVVITPREFEAELILRGWCKPADVAELKAKEGR